MVDTVKNMAPVLHELVEALRSDPRTQGMVVARMEVANTNAGAATSGWVGLYVDTVDYRPRAVTLGPQQWRAVPTFRIIVQATDLSSSEVAHDKLEKHLKDVLDVVLENTTLGETMGTLNSINVTYAFNEDERESMHFIGALVTMEFEGTTN